MYGGIEPSLNMVMFLRLPANLRLYDRIEKIIAEKKVEEAAVKDRWEERNKEEREDSGDMMADKLRKKKDDEYRERKACNSERINLAKIRTMNI